MPNYHKQISPTEVEVEVVCFSCKIHDILQGDITQEFKSVNGWHLVHFTVAPHGGGQLREAFAFFCHDCSNKANMEYVSSHLHDSPIGVL